MPKPHHLTIHFGTKCGYAERATIDAMMAVSGCISYSNLLRRAMANYADALEVDLPTGVFDDLQPGQGGGRAPKVKRQVA